MKFEEALVKMRSGAKITHPSFDKDVYFQTCRVGFSFDGNMKEDFPVSIVKMKGDREHPDMRPMDEVFGKQCKHGLFPQINLFLLMSDEWVIAE